MTWVKLDDGFFRNPKVLGLTKDARLLYLAGLCHCASSLTDGRITTSALRLVAAEADVKPAAARQLVTAGLWLETEDSYEVHDYLSYNPSRSDVEADREAARERMRRARDARKAGGSKRKRSPERSPEPPPNDTANLAGSSPNPVPSRPPVTRPLVTHDPPTTAAGADAPKTTTTTTDGYQPTDLPLVGDGLTPDMLWPEMARRTHHTRHQAGHRVPTSGPRRTSWLHTTATDLQTQHAQHAAQVIAETRHGMPADYIIWCLDKDLALHDWGVGPVDTDGSNDPGDDTPDLDRDQLARLANEARAALRGARQ